MRRVRLGRTDIEVSQLAFGGLFASSLGPGFDASRSAVEAAVHAGINYIDTAPSYANSEETLGRILGDIQSPLIVSTKLGGRPSPFNPRDPEQLRASVHESLRLLRRDVIDILFVHEPDRPGQYDWWSDPAGVNGPVIEVMHDLKRQGVIRYIGLGGTTSTELAHRMDSGRFDVVLTAFNYSALFREATLEIFPVAERRQMGVVLGSVLQQGSLARRYDDVVRAKPAWLARARQQQFLAFYELLDQSGIPIVELGLRFAISRNVAHTILIGPKTADQVQESVTAIQKGPLPRDVLERLDEIAAQVPGRPFEEPMVLPMHRPHDYWGPGRANTAAGAPVGKATDR